MTRLLKRYPITIFLLGLTGLIFIAMQVVYGHLATGAQAIYQVGGMFGLLVKAMPDQLWRLVTPIFIHIGFGHFFVNGLTLYFVGQIVEDLLAHAVFYYFMFYQVLWAMPLLLVDS